MAKYLDSTGLARAWTDIKSVIGLKVANTSQKKINVNAASSGGITFTNGTNGFTVSDGTNSFTVGVTPSVSISVKRLYLSTSPAVYYDPLSGGSGGNRNVVLLLSGDAAVTGLNQYNSGNYSQMELSVTVSKIKLTSSSGTGWYAIPIGNQLSNMSSGSSIQLWYSSYVGIQASTGDIKIGSKYVTKSSTQGLTIEVVSSMPASPNSNTIYIVI